MRNLLQIMMATVRAKMMPLWIKLRLFTSPAFIKTRVLVKVREFFSKLLDVRPRHKRDYYGIFNWLVSKRLAFSVVVALGLCATLYIAFTVPEGFWSGKSGGGVPTYKYRAIPLKFHSGSVKILARAGYVAYEGEVDSGVAAGHGTLYAEDGSTVYEGQFANNMYNGNGTRYYPDGTPQYVGGFTDNEFNGTGAYFRPNGTMEYQGDYTQGQRTGAGTLYNSVGDPVYQGTFLKDEISYVEFLARPTSDVSSLYSGATEVYQSDTEYCVAMPEIDAIYSVKDGSNTLENEWTVDRIYVLKDQIPLTGGNCTNVRQLQAELGMPLYYGTSWVTLPEAVASNRLAKAQPDLVIPVDVEASALLENVFSVSGYDRNAQIYLYTCEQEGLLYTFYFTEAGASEFIMYAIEKTA